MTADPFQLLRIRSLLPGMFITNLVAFGFPGMVFGTSVSLTLFGVGGY